MTERIRLRGITWNHTRGLVSVQATAQRWHELHPEVEITWEKRSLQAFADQPIQALAKDFDLLVIDHPFTGYAAKHKPLLDLQPLLPAAYLADQAANQVGGSHDSYRLDGGQWALAIDAATPVAGWRTDILDRLHLPPPQTWDELLALADRRLVAIAGIPIDSLMNFYTFCAAEGEDPFLDTQRVVSRETGRRAFAALDGLLKRCDPKVYGRNPIATWEAMSRGEEIAYCPFAYGYSVYARRDYARFQLTFGNAPSYGRAGMLRTTLGGTGIAVSASTRHAQASADYAAFCAAPQTQTGLWVSAGGQPGHRAAWLDQMANATHGNYFRSTLPTLDHAFLRPRYAGYLGFQDHAGPVLHDALTGKRTLDAALDEMDSIYRASLTESAHASA
jgi:multiple sugar transport system substrate-binding protein